MSDHQKFESNIPQHLLNNISDKDKWLMEEMSKNTQATEWLLHKREEDSVKIDEIVKQTKLTNGRVTKLEDNSVYLNKIAKELKGFAGFLSFSKRYLTNKYALVFIGIFIFGCVKVAISPEIRELLAKIIGLG